MRGLRAGTLGMVATTAVVGCGSSQHVPFSRWSSVRGLSVPTPAGFHEFRWAGGVAISDLSQRQVYVPYLESGVEGSFATYPGGVFLIVSGLSDPPAVLPPLRLPLDLAELRMWHEDGRWWDEAFQVGHRGNCVVEVWIGPKAPAVDRAAVLQALASIKSRGGST